MQVPSKRVRSSLQTRLPSFLSESILPSLQTPPDYAQLPVHFNKRFLILRYRENGEWREIFGEKLEKRQ
jgi:hypothetical protein